MTKTYPQMCSEPQQFTHESLQKLGRSIDRGSRKFWAKRGVVEATNPWHQLKRKGK